MAQFSSPFGSFLVVLVCCCPFWIFWLSLVVLLGSFGFFLTRFGSFSVVLSRFESFWVFLGLFMNRCSLFWVVWPVLVCCGRFLDVLPHFGLFWVVLDQLRSPFGSFWLILGGLGSFWLVLGLFLDCFG